MVFAVEQHASSNRRTDVSGSASESLSSNQSGSDVVIASNEPYSPGSGGGGSDTSEEEEGSVEVVDKTTRLDPDYSTPSNNGGSKSLSSRSHSSKSSSQASHTNPNSLSARTSSVRSSSASVPPFTYSYADFSQVSRLY